MPRGVIVKNFGSGLIKNYKGFGFTGNNQGLLIKNAYEPFNIMYFQIFQTFHKYIVSLMYIIEPYKATTTLEFEFFLSVCTFPH